MSVQQLDPADFGQGDAQSFSGSSRSSDASSNRSRVRSAQGSPARSPTSYSQDDFEDDKDTSSVLQVSHVSPVKKSPRKAKSFHHKVQKRSGVQNPHQKKSLKNGRKPPLFPPIRPLNGVGQRIASAREHRIKELSSLVWDLQQQLNGAWQENRLLRRVQSRHTVALQQFQDSQSGLPQILLKHGNEVHALQELLRKARAQRNSLARRLACIEDHLQQTTEELRRLQQLCRRRHLGEREDLTQRLSKLSLELEIKNKRIKDLERNLELSNTSFSRHLSTEMRKTVEARDLSKLLQEQISQLNLKIRERERELENQNIYSHRFPKAKKGEKETKCSQTEALSPLRLEAPLCKLEIEYESEEHLEKELEKQRSNRSRDLCSIDFSEPEKAENNQSLTKDIESEDGQAAIAAATEDTELGMSEEEQPSDSDDNCRHDDEGIYETPDDSWDTTHNTSSPSQLDTSLDLSELLGSSCPTTNKQTTPRARRHYTFKETIQNLHRGRPAYGFQKDQRGAPGGSSLDRDSAPYEPSFLKGQVGQGRPTRVENRKQTGEADLHSRKSSLMRELFGQADATETQGEWKSHAKDPAALSSDSDRTSAYVLGDTVSHIRDRFIIFD